MFFDDTSQERLTDILLNNKEEARKRALSLIKGGQKQEDGCITTGTRAIRKVRFGGYQFPAYRFIYCILNELPLSSEEVVRHRCHTRHCINPDHMTHGSRLDNKMDDWEYWANGLDRDFL